MAFGPTARYIREYRQNRQFVVVIPKGEWIVPKKDQAEEDNDYACCYRAKKFRTRGARRGHLRQKTPNAQRPTPNV
jgi:hypothetical protein